MRTRTKRTARRSGSPRWFSDNGPYTLAEIGLMQADIILNGLKVDAGS
ncbi:hypothetical protein [Nocardioides sp. Root190]|nr:hypothetical protein [Nocardioides sp. Root190]